MAAGLGSPPELESWRCLKNSSSAARVMQRLTESDVNEVASDRNVPGAPRLAAKKRAAASRG